MDFWCLLHTKSEACMKLLEFLFSLRENSCCVTSVLLNVTFSLIPKVRDSRSYWLEIWRMPPWPIWVLIAGPRGLRTFQYELKSKPCVNLHCTLSPRSRSLGSCKINHLKLLCPVSSVQISLPIPNYLSVIQHCNAKGEDLDVEEIHRNAGRSQYFM